MITEQFTGVEDTALVATKEVDVYTNFSSLIAPAVRGVRNKLACVKVWRSCCNRIDKIKNRFTTSRKWHMSTYIFKILKLVCHFSAPAH